MKDTTQVNEVIDAIFKEKAQEIHTFISNYTSSSNDAAIIQAGTIVNFFKKIELFGYRSTSEVQRLIGASSKMHHLMKSGRDTAGRGDNEKKQIRLQLDKELQKLTKHFSFTFPEDMFSRKIKSFQILMDAMLYGQWSNLNVCDYYFGREAFTPQFDLKKDSITQFEANHIILTKIVDAFVSAKIEGLENKKSKSGMRTILEVIYSNTDVDVGFSLPAIAQLVPFNLENSEDHDFPEYSIPDHAICLDTTKYKSEDEIKGILFGNSTDSLKSRQIAKFTKNKLLIIYSDYDERYRAINGDYNLSIFRLLEFLTNECDWDCILFSKKLDRSPIYVEDNKSVVRRTFFLDRNEVKDLKDGDKFKRVIEGLELDDVFRKRRYITDTPLSKDSFDIVDLLADLFRSTNNSKLKTRMNKDIAYITSAIVRDDILSLGRYLFNISKTYIPFFKLTISILVLSKVSLSQEKIKEIITILLKFYPDEICQFFRVDNVNKDSLEELFESDFDFYFKLAAKLLNNEEIEEKTQLDVRPRLKVKMTVAMSNDKDSFRLRRIIHWILACHIQNTEISDENEDIRNFQLQIDTLSHLLASCDIDNEHMEPSVFKPRENWVFGESFWDYAKKKNSTHTLRNAFLLYDEIEGGDKHAMSNFGDMNQVKKDLVVKFLNAGYPFTIADVVRYPQQNYSLPPISFCLIDSLGKSVMTLFEGLVVSALRCQDNSLLESAFSYIQSVVNMIYWDEHTHLPHPIRDISTVLEQKLSFTSNTRIETTKLHFMIRTGQLTRAQFIVRRNLCGILQINTVGGFKSINKLVIGKEQRKVHLSEKLTNFFIKSMSQLIRIFIYRMNIYGAKRLFDILRVIRKKYEKAETKKGLRVVSVYAQSFDLQHQITLTIKEGDPNKTFFPPIGESMEIYRLCTYIRGVLDAKKAEHKKSYGHAQDVEDELEKNIYMNNAIINDIENDLNNVNQAKDFKEPLYETNKARLRLYNLYKKLNETDLDRRTLSNLTSELPEFGGVWPGKYLEVLSIYVSCRETLSLPFLADETNSVHLLKLNYKLNKLLVLCKEFNFLLLHINCELLYIINLLLNALNPATYNPFSYKVDNHNLKGINKELALVLPEPEEKQSKKKSLPRNTSWSEIDLRRAKVKLDKRLRAIDQLIQEHEYFIKNHEFEQVNNIVKLFLDKDPKFRLSYHTVQQTLIRKPRIEGS